MPRFEQYAVELGCAFGLSDVVFYRSGAFKETYRAIEHATGIPVALKLMPHTQEGHLRLSREVEGMRKCNSSLFARLFYVGTHSAEDGTQIAIVIEEFLEGGTLGDRIAERLLPVTECVKLGIHLVKALRILQEQQCVHRDIKPENIMFRANSDVPVLVDFGLVRDLGQPSATFTWLPSGPGTPFFAAPEQLNNDKDLIDWRTDQFALGVVLSIASTGMHPYQSIGEGPHEVVSRVATRQKVSTQTRLMLTEKGFAAIIKMTRAWPVHRFLKIPTLEDSLNALL